MDTRPAPEHPLERQRAAARTLDESIHALLARTSQGLSPISLALAQADWALHLAASPGRQMVLAQRALDLALQAWQNAGSAAAEDQPEMDARFAEPVWRQWPYSALKEGFKAYDVWWREAAELDGVSQHHQHMVRFFARQALDALSPSNWAWTNPEVLRLAQETQGRSLLEGWRNVGEDLRAQMNAQADTPPQALPPLPYAVGRDVAVTPGKVVFRNGLIELIRYTPTTAQVAPQPLLIVPSCIMKYYILDLSPGNSMVRYLVDQGYTVFIISWRNPDAADRDLGMEDYLRRGVVEAMAAVRAQTGAPRIHALGYCLGGTFLAIVAAALARAQAPQAAAPGGRRKRAVPAELPELATITLLAAQTDFSEPGELGVFIDDDQLKTLREKMARTGYLSGRQMAGSFQFLNSRDLVWSRATRRYLLGQDEVGNDMMSWNADTTRLPARMHSEYLSSLFLNNALASGQYRMDGEGVALRDIRAPLFVVGTVRDHVSPWRSVYKLHLLADAPITFVLAAGGHNAGIVSEPGHPRRSYQIASRAHGDEWIDPDTWQTNAPVLEGSWWVALHEWLRERSGPPVPARPIDPATVLCDAPGSYVMQRYAD